MSSKDGGRLPPDFAADFYAAAQRGERPRVPIADDAGVDRAESSTWANLQKPGNRYYGFDICMLKLIARIHQLQRELADARDGESAFRDTKDDRE